MVLTLSDWCCRLSRGGSAAFGEAAAAAPPDQVAQVAQARAQNPGARGMDLAAKMMEKMGWKSGLGLGRNKQVPVVVLSQSVRAVGCRDDDAIVPYWSLWTIQLFVDNSVVCARHKCGLQHMLRAPGLHAV